MKKFFAILCAVTLFLSFAQAKTITLISMDIPPFMSPSLPEQGAAIYGLRQMFKKIGYNVDVRFVPVPRIRTVGLGDSQVNGFFPSFIDDDFLNGFELSKLFYKTPWVIVERKDLPIKWKTAGDLLKYRGGNVAGYTLRSQVADIYEENKTRLELAPNDTSNILKLIHGRVDFIFIDQNVFKFISATNPDVKPYADSLQINSKIVALNEYGIAFKKNKQSKLIMDRFNKVADEKEFTEAVERYISMYMKSPPK